VPSEDFRTGSLRTDFRKHAHSRRDANSLQLLRSSGKPGSFAPLGTRNIRTSRRTSGRAFQTGLPIGPLPIERRDHPPQRTLRSEAIPTRGGQEHTTPTERGATRQTRKTARVPTNGFRELRGSSPTIEWDRPRRLWMKEGRSVCPARLSGATDGGVLPRRNISPIDRRSTHR
jgi:hypothetical protein